MKISPEQLREIAKLYEAQSRGRVARKAETPSLRPDRVDLSSEAQLLQAVMRQVKASPGIRPEKVEELKARIERGEYHVSAHELARRLVKGFVSKGDKAE